MTWEVEPAADACRLTVIHDELAGGARPELYGSWPVILSALKTFLETGQDLAAPGPRGTLAGKIARLLQAQADELLSAAGQAPGSGQAIELLKRAVDRDPGNVQARFELGVALSQAADYEAAIGELRTVLGLQEDLPEGWRELGVVLSRSGQLTAAEEAFRRSLELDEGQPENLVQPRRPAAADRPLPGRGHGRPVRLGHAARGAGRLRPCQRALQPRYVCAGQRGAGGPAPVGAGPGQRRRSWPGWASSSAWPGSRPTRTPRDAATRGMCSTSPTRCS